MLTLRLTPNTGLFSKGAVLLLSSSFLLTMPTTHRSIFVMELEKLLVHGKITALFQTAVMCAKHYISNATNKKTDFEELIG